MSVAPQTTYKAFVGKGNNSIMIKASLKNSAELDMYKSKEEFLVQNSVPLKTSGVI